MVSVRILEIPPMKAAYSGPLTTQARFEAFHDWFSAFHASLKYELYPRDFMWYNERIGAREWFYALPGNLTEADCGGFEIRDLPAGLFAVASCLDADLDQARDWMQTRQALIQRVNDREAFALYENQDGKPERYPMFHIASPGGLIPEGISIEDLYVPIVKKTKTP